jgi:predicted dehydrogenase
MPRIIQVGAGGWGKSWLKFINESKDWELAALVSRGGDNLERAQAEWSIPDAACFTELERALAVDADAVLVTVPHHLHAAVSTQALEAGKHVLCEKPFSDDFESAKGLVASAKAAGKKLVVGQNFRFRRGLWQMKAAARRFGGAFDSLSVAMFQSQGDSMIDWRKRQISLLLLEIMIHHVDMARFLMDSDAANVFCRAWNPSWSLSDGPASAAVVIEFANGATMNYNASWAARGQSTGWEGLWRVQCENGAARWDGKDLSIQNADGQSVGAPSVDDYPGDDRHGLLTEFARSIAEDRSSIIDGEDNLGSLSIIFAAIRSFQERRVVSIDEIAGD